MSLKKDKFSKKQKNYMELALNLASERTGITGTNPSVGCVIVKNDNIISVGQTSIYGRPHAEFNAIKNSKQDLSNSEMYVTLEPCSHYGKTPPCTKHIINSKIKKIYYAIDDVDLRSSKKAYSILRKKKILVKKYLLKKYAQQIYKSYFFNKKHNLPYVTGKIACSKDRKIFSLNKYISNFQSRNVSHLFRYKNQAILITVKTANIDNPMLTCRLSGLEKYSPARILLDKNLLIKKNSFIVTTSNKIKTYIFFNNGSDAKKKYLKSKKVKLIKCNLNSNNQLSIRNILIKIKKLGIHHLLVEGGKDLTMSFLNENLFNEFYLFKSNKKLRNKGKINISNVINKLNSKFKNKKKVNTYLDKDELINYY